jgi:hypothetical protein
MRRLETPPYQFALADEPQLRALFERVLREPPTGSEETHVAALRNAVCVLVRRGKASGLQIETVIVALKDIFAVPDRPNRSLRGDEDTPPQVVLVRRVVRWCIQEYYGPGTERPR